MPQVTTQVADPARSGTQTRDGVLDASRTEVGVVDRGDRLARRVLRILEDVRDRVDRPDHGLL